jgi:hypothetical protein
MLASKNMRPAITSLESGQGWLRVLCVELIGRLKDARGGEDEERVDIWPKTLVLSWRVGQLPAFPTFASSATGILADADPSSL